MPLFCDICNNLLSVITTASTFYFKCAQCQKRFKPLPDDSLRYEESTGINLLIYKKILQNAAKDPLNPKVLRDCPNCKKKTIIRQVRLGDDLRLINTCIKCEKQWIDGAH